MFTIDLNRPRHLTNSYSYAHFSRINQYNYFFFLQFLFYTKPIYITLNQGEALYIPKKWWHWVHSNEQTMAINFWFDNELLIKPQIIQHLYTNEERNELHNNLVNTIHNNDIFIWDTASNFSFEENGKTFLESKLCNSYLITLDGYHENISQNNKIKLQARDYIKTPNIIKGFKNMDYNIWISSKFVDTGLHFDDNEGILFVIEGTKQIILYPPSDTKYLMPYKLEPDYTQQPTIQMNYNANIFIKNTFGYPSEMLLYKTIEFCALSNKVSSSIQTIYNNKNINSKLIYGFKKEKNIYRWEIYFYHYNYKTKYVNKDGNKNIYNKNTITEFASNELDNIKTIINSVDILNQDDICNHEIHTYEYKYSLNFEMPFYGYGFDIIKDIKTKVGCFVYSTQKDIIYNINKYLDELKLHYHENIFSILYKYNCEDMCIWNKNDTLFLQWFMISIDDFIQFLIEFQYKPEFIHYVIANNENYRNISHEITIVYDMITYMPIRCGFYGCM